MKNIIKVLIKGLTGIFLVALLALNIQVGFVDSNDSDTLLSELTLTVFTNQTVAQVTELEDGVTCSCAFWWFNNDKCLANNGGSQCTVDEENDCQTANSNCG